ncbi:MAG: malectin domain-containing carbohydrate-binding protein [Bacteroidota bacterium]
MNLLQNFYPNQKLKSFFCILVFLAAYLVPTYTFGQNIWLEPECGSSGANWSIKTDAQASGDSYITYELNDSFSEPPATGDDQVRIAFTVVQAGNYKVWARAKAPQGAGDSFWFRLDNEEWIKWKSIKKGDTFNWGRVLDSDNGNQNVSVNLTAGEHLITIGYRERNVQLDKVFLSLEATTPSGVGGESSNCGPRENAWLEAECATVGENLSSYDNDQASQNQAILMNGADQLSAPSNDPNDRIILEVEVPESGNYNVFGRLSSEDEEANSLWLKANNDNWVNWDNIGESGIQASQVTTNSATDLPVIPGYAAFAMDAKAGRGGKVYKITNLKDSGSGSLRECVNASGARVCVFETSGVIRLKDQLKIRNPFITIAGQTAPDPGVMIFGHQVVIETNNVLIQHIGMRAGDLNYNGSKRSTDYDCVSIRKGSDRVILDHVSLGWGADENMDLLGNVGEVCLRNVMITNALNAKNHGFGALFYDRGKVSVEGSLFANLDQRQPMSRVSHLIHVNNLHYNRGLRFAQFSAHQSTDNKTLNSLVGNVYVEGPSRRGSIKPILLHRGDLGPGTKMYLKDNYWKSNINSSGSMGNQWSLVEDQGGNGNIKADKAPVWVNGIRVLTEEKQIIDYVLTSVGPRPARRNYLDQQVIEDYQNDNGRIIDCISGCSNNAGGIPKLAENTRRLSIPLNPNGDEDGDGYTNLEEWLHQLAAEVEGKPYEPGDNPGGGNQPSLVGAFSWHKLTDANQQDFPKTVNLQAGKNIIEIARREAGVILDKLYLTKAENTPGGLGGNAYNCTMGAEEFTSIRINAGGSTYNASGNKIFVADNFFTLPSNTAAYNAGVSETLDEGLYKTERKGNAFGYNIPLANGEYDIRLRFAELRWLESGKRRFNVKIEGAAVLNNFDIFSSGAFGMAVDREFQRVSVQDGTLNIDLQATAGEAQICAIEVLPAGSLNENGNTAPSFTISGDLLLTKDFEGIKAVNVFPDPVSEEEASQGVTYSLTPAFSLISNISINQNTGEVQVKALNGVTGSEEFTIVANDGQDKNNIYTQTFKLVILSDEPTSVGNGGSTIRINAGGPAFTNSAGLEFQADKYFLGNTSEYTVNSEIAGTQDDVLYQSERWGYEFSYQIPVINGEYNVVLHFAEVYWSDAGKRVFDISAEGEEYFSSYDIYEEYGKNAVAVEVLNGVIVADGVLNLDFLSRKHMAKISAIEVITTYNPGLASLDSRQSVRINCGENEEKAFGGYIFQPDVWFVSNNTNSLLNDNIGIASTNYDEIYRTARSSQISGEGFGYKIPVENGQYVVYLHFAEIYWGVPGGATGGKGNRIFTITMEDEVIDETYDILDKTAPGSAYVERIEIEVTDGFLDLDLNAINGKPIISAIEILTPAEEETSIGSQSYLDQQGSSILSGIFNDVKVFPNPANSATRLMVNSEIDGDFEMSIINMQGQILVKETLRKTGPIAKYMLPVEELAPGIYLVRLHASAEISTTIKLIKPE